LNTTEIAIIFIIGSLTLFVFVLFIVLILVEYRKRQVRHITEKLQLEHRYRSEVLQTQIEVQEQSFRYLSEEIHDNIAQTLSLVKLKLYKTANMAEGAVKERIEGSTDLLGNALEGLRNLSHVLNGGLVSKLTLEENIEKELGYVHDVKDIHTQLILKGPRQELKEKQKLLAFRIVQEAIINAVKHGRAHSITITIEYMQQYISLTIADDGKGFDLSLLDNSKGLGLHNMQVRAKMLGNYKIDSAVGKGTTITLNIDTNEQ
jgi:signal transduction histidine kinase